MTMEEVKQEFVTKQPSINECESCPNKGIRLWKCAELHGCKWAQSMMEIAKMLESEPCDDCISRQEVSDIIKTRLYQTALNNTECITSYDKVCEDIAENRIDTWINEAKSVEPKKEKEGRDCASCKHSNNGECAYTEECHKCMWESQYEKQVEPERKTGKWIEGKKTPGYIKWNCSKCGLLVRNSQKPWYEYCPKCGAKMEVKN